MRRRPWTHLRLPRLTISFSFLLLALLSLSEAAYCIQIRHGLGEEDRREYIRTLGLNTAEKVLSNPYPLGGYSGFEIGYSLEFVDVRDLRRLGCTPSTPATASCPSYADDTEWRFSRLTIGKGLYNDVDIFFSMMMPLGGVRASDYGGMLRWSFYQAQFLPINLSFLVHADQLNFGDAFMNRNIGGELLAGVNVDNFAVYFGGGLLEANGTFNSCVSSASGDSCVVERTDSQINSNTHTVSHTLHETHTVVGFSLHFQNLFAAAQVDRYADAVYSMKLGLRF